MTHWWALCSEGPWVKGGANANPGASEESVWWTVVTYDTGNWP